MRNKIIGEPALIVSVLAFTLSGLALVVSCALRNGADKSKSANMKTVFINQRLLNKIR
jgi:hypothetical protein